MNTCYSVQTDLAEGQNITLLKLSLFTQILKLNFVRNRTSNQSSISASYFINLTSYSREDPSAKYQSVPCSGKSSRNIWLPTICTPIAYATDFQDGTCTYISYI